MAVIQHNCRYCSEYKSGKCKGDAADCICRRCPRNLGHCLITRYCRETESILTDEE